MNEKQRRRQKRKEKKARHERHREEAKVEVEVQKEMQKYPLQMVRENARENICGECQACCMAVGVHEVEKPMWTPCKHQCETGCGIYEDRPDSCRGYYCLYQAGMLTGGVEMRPDKLGIIFDFRATSTDGDAISAWEVREGAADDPRVMEMLRKIGDTFIVIVRRYKSAKRRIIGPAHLINGMTFQEFN
jgi:hypothetical protein